MIYLKARAPAGKEVHLVVLEAGNLVRIKDGKPAVTSDKEVVVTYTPDLVWLAMAIKDLPSDHTVADIYRLVEDSQKRPQKPAERPYHKPDITVRTHNPE